MMDSPSHRQVSAYVQVSAKEYWDASVDPVAQFSAPVCGHMNADHGDASIAMVRHFTGEPVDKVTMLSIDRYGINTECIVGDTKANIRLAFPEPAEDRKAVKDRVVAMASAAVQTAAPASAEQ
jgi:putative heme iron utilization protein